MFKVRMKFSKTGQASFISHLDLMHCMQRIMARAEMPVWFTEGFNPHAYVSVALPLSTGFSGESEFLDFQLVTDEIPTDALDRMNAVMPAGLKALAIYPLSEGRPVRDIAYSKYEITYEFDNGVPAGFADAVTSLLNQENVSIVKRSKRGEAEVNMKELMRGFSLETTENTVKMYVITAAGNSNLSPEYITKAIAQYLPEYIMDGVTYHRLSVYDNDLNLFQ